MLEKRKVTKFQTGHQTTQKLLKNKKYYNNASLHAMCIVLCTTLSLSLYLNATLTLLKYTFCSLALHIKVQH